MKEIEPPTTSTAGRRQSNLGLYRIAMAATALMAFSAMAMLLAHWRFGLLTAKSVKVMTFGSVFWLLIAAGYRADWKARAAEEAETP